MDKQVVLEEKMVVLRDIWEETSFQLELRQANPECVTQEREGLKSRKHPPYHMSFTYPEVYSPTKGNSEVEVLLKKFEIFEIMIVIEMQACTIVKRRTETRAAVISMSESKRVLTSCTSFLERTKNSFSFIH